MATEIVVEFKSVGDEDVLHASKTIAKQMADLKKLAATPIETKFVQSGTSGDFGRVQVSW